MSAAERERLLQLTLLVGATAAGVFARAAVSPLQEAMRAALALDDNRMALLQGPAMAIPVIAAATPVGLIIDRYSRTHLVIVCCACLAIGTIVTALSTRFAVLLAARSLVGLVGPVIWMAAMSLMADFYQPERRGRANMAIVVGQCLANSAAFSIGGVLLGEFTPGPDQWRHALLWMSAPLVLMAVVALFMREPARAETRVKPASNVEAFMQLWRYRRTVAPVMIGLSMLGVADGAAVTWVAPALMRRYALAPDRVGALLGSVLLVSGLAGPIFGGMLADFAHRRGGTRCTLWALSGLAVIAIPSGLFAWAISPAGACAMLLVFMSSAGAIIVAGTTLLTILVPNELRGLCMALVSAGFLLFGFAVAPPLVSALSLVLGGPTLLGKALAWVCASTSCLGCLAFSFAGARRSLEEYA